MPLESSPTIFENALVGLVLGGFVTDFTKKLKLVLAAKGLELKVIEALTVLLVIEQDTADVSVDPAHTVELLIE